jgi:hypothetical protein
MNETLAALTELQPIARRMRERQEQIERDKSKVYDNIGNLIASAQEQGQDILTAKAKLGKKVKWSDWLHAHVPSLSEQDATKYERLTTEQLSDPRQCMFAFLPNAERKDDVEVERTKPNAKEFIWRKISTLRNAIKTFDIGTWAAPDIELTKKELEPVARALWPEKF